MEITSTEVQLSTCSWHATSCGLFYFRRKLTLESQTIANAKHREGMCMFPREVLYKYIIILMTDIVARRPNSQDKRVQSLTKLHGSLYIAFWFGRP